MLIELHGFTATSQDRNRLKSLFNRLVKEKVLFKGSWRKRGRVGFRTLLYLADTHLEVGLKDGIPTSWDPYISRLLSIVLVSACASRAGDVVRSRLYTDMECMCFKDLSVQFFEGNTTEDLILNVCLRFVKGYK